MTAVVYVCASCVYMHDYANVCMCRQCTCWWPSWRCSRCAGCLCTSLHWQWTLLLNYTRLRSWLLPTMPYIGLPCPTASWIPLSMAFSTTAFGYVVYLIYPSFPPLPCLAWLPLFTLVTMVMQCRLCEDNSIVFIQSIIYLQFSFTFILLLPLLINMSEKEPCEIYLVILVYTKL